MNATLTPEQAADKQRIVQLEMAMTAAVDCLKILQQNYDGFELGNYIGQAITTLNSALAQNG